MTLLLPSRPRVLAGSVTLGLALVGAARLPSARAAEPAETGPPGVARAASTVSPPASEDVSGLVGRGAGLPPARARFEVHLAQRLLARGLPLQAAEILRRVVRSAPDHPGGWLLLSRALQDANQVREAVEAADRAVQALVALDPPRRASFDNAAFYEHLGIVRSAAVDLDGAADALELALRLDPRRTAARVHLGALLLRRGRDDEAARELERATGDDPDQQEAWRSLGQALIRLERFEEARTALETARRLDPEDPDTRYQLATVLRAVDDFEGQERELLEFDRLRQARDERRRARDEVELRLREIAELLREESFAEAVTPLEALLEEPEVAERGFQLTRVLADLGRCQQELGDLDAARRTYERALRARPGAFLVSFELGTLLAQQGHPDLAAPHLIRAAAANPFDYAAHLNLGLCFGLLGRLNDALGELRRAVALQPEQVAARQLLLELEWAVGHRAQARALMELGGLEPPSGTVPREGSGWAP